jgi:hypothetical protein
LTVAAVDVDRGRGHGAGAVGGDEGGHVLEGGRPAEHGLPLDLGDDRLAPLHAGGDRLGHAAGPQGHEPDPVAAQLGGELAAHGLDGLEGDLEASQVVVAWRLA